jgi:hypothetical protein
LFGASPGALAQVIVLATEYGTDVRAIAIVQVMRVVILTIGIPTGLAYFGLAASGLVLPMPGGAPATLVEMAVLVGVSTAAGVALLWAGFPGGLMFGSMLASGALHGFGLIPSSLPQWLIVTAVIAVGAITGSRFAKTDPRTLLRYLGPALGSFAVAISIASAFVLLLTTILPVRIADAVVAFAPGAQDTMMVLALALGLDPIFVGAHHLSRYLLVSVSVPLLARWLGPPPPAGMLEHPPRPPQRPTIED